LGFGVKGIWLGFRVQGAGFWLYLWGAHRTHPAVFSPEVPFLCLEKVHDGDVDAERYSRKVRV
jgi:hypothetical protein